MRALWTPCLPSTNSQSGLKPQTLSLTVKRTQVKTAARDFSRQPAEYSKQWLKDNPEYTYMAIDGVDNCMEALTRYRKRKNT